MFSITDDVIYVGVKDDVIDLFEGQYILPEGVTYNSYVIIDDVSVVLDTVDLSKSEEWLGNVKTALNGRIPGYLVISHLEPDHSGTIKQFLELYPECVALCSAKGVPMMKRFFDETLASRARAVAEGETLSLGKHTLQFFMAPMVHWPEVMVTYDAIDKILFSADAFGTFGSASSADNDWVSEARRYYINICGKYGPSVQSLLKKAANLDINTICPLHGPVLTGNIDYNIDLYDKWSRYAPEEKGIFIAYCSLHGNTAEAAKKLVEILHAKSPDTKVETRDLVRDDMADAVAQAFRFDRLVLAAPTYDGNIMPAMDHFISHLHSKAYQKRRFAVIENGSWAPVAGKKMVEKMLSLKDMTFIQPMITVESVVKESTLQALNTLADNLLD